MKHLIFIITFFVTILVSAQNVGVNSTGAIPDASAILDVESTDKGLLIPRVDITDLTTAAPVATPATSLLVYNTNTTTGIGYYYWDASKWVKLIDGNTVTDDHDWYEVGTTTAPDNINDDIFTQGKVGIGTAFPSEDLHINSVGGDRSSVFVGATGSGEASIYLDASNGDFSGSDYLSILQSNDLKAHIYVASGLSNTSVLALQELGGKVGIAGDSPKAFLDVLDLSLDTLKTVLARLPEGDGTGKGTYLGVFSHDSQPASVNSFSIEHRFYDKVNSSINFIRGSTDDDGEMSFATANNTERMRIDFGGNVGIGTSNPATKLHVNGYARFKVPTFLADGGTAHQNYNAGKLIFTTEIIDNSNCYNPATGRFTAAIPGIYKFFVDLDIHGTNTTGQADFFLSKNGTNVLLYDIDSPSGGYLNHHLEGFISLNVGDYVEVNIATTVFIAMSNWSKFGGCYVSDL